MEQHCRNRCVGGGGGGGDNMEGGLFEDHNLHPNHRSDHLRQNHTRVHSTYSSTQKKKKPQNSWRLTAFHTTATKCVGCTWIFLNGFCSPGRSKDFKKSGFRPSAYMHPCLTGHKPPWLSGQPGKSSRCSPPCPGCPGYPPWPGGCVWLQSKCQQGKVVLFSREGVGGWGVVGGGGGGGGGEGTCMYMQAWGLDGREYGCRR